MYYTRDDLLATVTAFISATPELAEHVELRGHAPLAEMESIYSSADFLLQASLREWSGLAIMEALSCGCIPVVSDIPSFRVLTANGRFGRLFPIGDDSAMANAVLECAESDRARLASEARDFFERELSFEALAEQLDGVYGAVVGAERKPQK
jgi:glycosyltransferase involved in cell wall biosynthesis